MATRDGPRGGLLSEQYSLQERVLDNNTARKRAAHHVMAPRLSYWLPGVVLLAEWLAG